MDTKRILALLLAFMLMLGAFGISVAALDEEAPAPAADETVAPPF